MCQGQLSPIRSPGRQRAEALGLFRRLHKLKMRRHIREVCGWETWIRTRINGVRVRVAVVFPPPHKGLHILRAYNLHLMPKRFKLARSVECPRAGFYDNGAAFDLGQRCDELTAKVQVVFDNQNAHNLPPA